ncbi:Cell division cycle 7related protein kinase, partial [Acanthamoeba castellanii str. Neff]
KVLQAENSSDVSLQNYIRNFLGVTSAAGERGSIARAFLQARGHGRRAGRAGTRGFRAPEVLMRSTYQTTALDVWSAGVILLCILTTRYPFFHSPDDMTALAEVACITGTNELQQTAALLEKRVLFPEARAKMDWRALCLSLTANKNVYDFPPEVFDLLDRCLTPNPCLRITAAEALHHPFLRGVSPASFPQMQSPSQRQ